MRRLALIPARGGSKRLPRKNIADFIGRPMIAWTIAAAKESGLFERVVVSTEDAEIAAISKKYGAETVTRNPALATDKARVVDVCIDFLDQDEKAGRVCDVLCCLYATAPLRTAADIRAAAALLQPGQCDFSLCATHYSLPPHQALRLGSGSAVTPMWPELIKKRDEEVGELVVDNGSTYFVSVPAFRKERSFFGPGTRAHIMPRERSHDINEPVDLEILKFFAGKAAA
jgi:CMP-N-acetylneuraminic acid synthetase